MRRLTLIGLLALLPLGALAKNNRAQADEPTPTVDQPTITYLGATYALLPDCFGTAFVVGITSSPAGQSDLVLVAIPFPGGVAVQPPMSKPATGSLANAALNDALCLDLSAQ